MTELITLEVGPEQEKLGLVIMEEEDDHLEEEEYILPGERVKEGEGSEYLESIELPSRPEESTYSTRRGEERLEEARHPELELCGVCGGEVELEQEGAEEESRRVVDSVLGHGLATSSPLCSECIEVAAEIAKTKQNIKRLQVTLSTT